MIRYVTAEDMLVLHALVIDETGGTHGVRDVNLLASLAERPKTTFGGVEQYKDIFTKAAVLCEGIVNYHVFVDGNKRTAFMSLGRFMAINRFSMIATNEEIVEVMVLIAEKKVSIGALSEWIAEHSVQGI